MSVYRISLPGGFFYFGSTCSSLQDRFWCHKGASKVYPDRLLYKVANDWEGSLIEEVEKVSGDKLARRVREQYYIDQNKTDSKCLNQFDAFCSIDTLKAKKANRQRIRRQTLTEEEKEQKRIRHNQQQNIRRANKRAEIISQV